MFEGTQKRTIIIPDQVETIEVGAFEGVASLQKVNTRPKSKLCRLERTRLRRQASAKFSFPHAGSAGSYCSRGIRKVDPTPVIQRPPN
jgi:hypothetical protein